jgi:hypothetical protein
MGSYSDISQLSLPQSADWVARGQRKRGIQHETL